MATIGGVSKNAVINWITGRKPVPLDVGGAFFAAMRREIFEAQVGRETKLALLVDYERMVVGESGSEKRAAELLAHHDRLAAFVDALAEAEVRHVAECKEVVG